MTKDEFINNLRGIDQNNDVDSPSVVEQDDIERDAHRRRKIFRQRRLQKHERLRRFQLTGVDTKMSLDLVTYMYETVWFHFHAIVKSLLIDETTDMRVQFSALDILCYSLTSSIFLNMKIESSTLAKLLRQYSEICWRNKHNVGSGSTTAVDDSWFHDVEKANADTAPETIAKVHQLIVRLKDAIQETTNKEITQQVAARFEKKTKVLDTNTFFVKQGDLTKLNRSNRPVTYRFFLFSDELIYAHLGMKNEYKSFVVVAESPVSKQQWLRDIRQTIESCKKRELNRTTVLNRRMSMYGRIDGQGS
eukprot:gene28875-37887_t